MDLREAFFSLGVAVGAGALIGAEREQARLAEAQRPDGQGPVSGPPAHRDFGGIRSGQSCLVARKHPVVT